MSLPGTVTCLAEAAGFLFIAFEAPMPDVTADSIAVGHIQCIGPGGETMLQPPGHRFAHRTAVFSMAAVLMPGHTVPVLFSGSSDGGLCMWSHSAAGWSRLQLGDGHARAVTSVRWHQRMGRLLTGSLDETIAVWDPANLEAPTKVFLPRESGHQGPVVSVRVLDFGAEPVSFASADATGVVTIWKATSPDAASVIGRCDGFARNPLTSMEVLDLVGSSTPLIAVGNKNGAVTLRKADPTVSLATVVKGGTAHKTGPVVLGCGLPGSPGFISGAGDRTIAGWTFRGPGGSPPALAAMAAAGSAAAGMPAAAPAPHAGGVPSPYGGVAAAPYGGAVAGPYGGAAAAPYAGAAAAPYAGSPFARGAGGPASPF